MTTDKIVTTIAVPPASPLPAPPHGDQISWIIGAAASFIATLLWLRRKTSRDSTEIAKDRAEENLIGTLRAERDRAMAAAAEAWDRRTKDAEEIAGLSAKNAYLEREVARLSTEMTQLQMRLAQVTDALARLPQDTQLNLRPL
ncbi:MAG: hypothetical protein LCH79_15995 [Proteobacteria bacterium]|nr:hypothetical protein [Pseudomonadota bacterium]